MQPRFVMIAIGDDPFSLCLLTLVVEPLPALDLRGITIYIRLILLQDEFLEPQ
jgi:hypothetical protein